jgi:hypothetical protein
MSLTTKTRKALKASLGNKNALTEMESTLNSIATKLPLDGSREMAANLNFAQPLSALQLKHWRIRFPTFVGLNPTESVTLNFNGVNHVITVAGTVAGSNYIYNAGATSNAIKAYLDSNATIIAAGYLWISTSTFRVTISGPGDWTLSVTTPFTDYLGSPVSISVLDVPQAYVASVATPTYKVTGMASGSADNHAATVGQMNAAIAAHVPADNSLNASKLVTDSIQFTQLSNAILKYTDSNITSVEFGTISTVPVELVPAPGAGFALAVEAVYYQFIYGTTPYVMADPGDTLKIGSALGETIHEINNVVLEGAVSVRKYIPAPIRALRENDNLTIRMSISNIGTGNSVLKVRVYYRVVPVNT